MKSIEKLFDEIMEEVTGNKIFICSFQSGVFAEETIINDLKLKKFKKAQVFVYPNEGDYKPHFHVVGDNGEYESCIRIDENEYFLHKSYHIEMNNRDLKLLDKALRKTRSSGETYWEYMKKRWNDARTKIKIPEETTQPNYTILNEVKK